MKNHALWYLSPLFIALAALAFASSASQFNAFRLLAKAPESRRIIQRVIQSEQSEQGAQSDPKSLTQRLIRLQCPFFGSDFYFSISLNENDEITGLTLSVPRSVQKTYKLEELEAGTDLNAPEGSPAAYINPVGRLQSIDFHPARGGSIRFEFVKNAMTRSRASYEFIITKDQDHWVAQDAQSRQNFSYALLVPNTIDIPFMGKKSVGIAGVSVQPD